ADIGARMPFRAALTNDDVACHNLLIAEFLDAETTAGGITTVARRTACFFVSHGSTPVFCIGCRIAYSEAASAGAASSAAALVVFFAAAFLGFAPSARISVIRTTV